MSFAAMKKNRKKSLADTIEQAKKFDSKGSSNKDDRMWQPTVDKAGNGAAVIRFLPKSEGEVAPWVQLFSHGFKGPGGWFIDNCLTTIGKDCPVCEANGVLWNSDIPANRSIVSGTEGSPGRKRKMNYMSNIYVVKDPGNPDNEGKVFLYKYGKKIFDKLNDMMYPEFDDEEAIDPFNLWTGADFKMKIRKVEGWRNFDKSTFAKAAALSEDDDALEAIYNSQHSLAEFVAPENYKSFDEQKTRMDKVLGNVAGVAPAPAQEAQEEDLPWAKEETSAPTAEADSLAESSADDDDMSFFKGLAADD
jgi:hypothetical protein